MIITPVRDIIYFDFGRAASLLSQLDQGLIESIEDNKEKTLGASGEVEGGVFLVAKGKAETSIASAKSTITTKKLHHDLLTRLFERLEDRGLIRLPPSPGAMWRAEAVTKPQCVASGFVALDDYTRMRAFANNFGWLADFVSSCMANSDEPNAAQMDALEKLHNAHSAIIDPKANTSIEKRKKELKAARQIFHNAFSDHIDVPENWLLEGIGKMLQILSAADFRIRMLIDDEPEFVANGFLQRQWFVDGDSDQVLACYGTRPNVPLVMLGTICNLPSKEFIHPLTDREPVVDATDEDAQAIHHAFVNMFNSISDIEDKFNAIQYPDIVIQPIAIFREC